MASILASNCCYCRYGEFINNERTGEKMESQAKLGINGRLTKMVLTTEVRKGQYLPLNTPEMINGIARNANGIHKVNGVSIVKKNPASPLMKSTSSKELPPIERLKVLPSDEGFSWANENYNAFQKSVDVWTFVLSLRPRVLFDNAKWAYLGGFAEDKQRNRRRKTASWLRERVLQLGPKFIKLGQLSSTRSDLFPREFVDELAKLQDKVPAFSPSKAKKFIERELGAYIDQLYKEFDDLPIASASLGQVHRAVLHDGEKVVVKIQRPGLKKLFDIDLRNLKLIAEYFQKGDTLGGPTRDWIGIHEECSKSYDVRKASEISSFFDKNEKKKKKKKWLLQIFQNAFYARTTQDPLLIPPEENELLGGRSGGGGGDGGEGRDWTTSFLLFAFWAGLMYYVCFIAPNQTPLTDSYFLEKLLNLKGDDGFQLNEVLVALWYIMGLWPLVYSMLLLPTGRSSKGKIPVWPFLALSFFGGAYALIPYFILWRPPAPPIKETELRRWPLNFLESKLTAGITLAAGLVIVIYAGLSGGDAWKEFYQYFGGSKFIHVMSVDFTLLSAFAPFWVYNDLTARKRDKRGFWLLALSVIPFLGPSVYLLLRPSIPAAPVPLVFDEK